jgi:hypothetical protein
MRPALPAGEEVAVQEMAVMEADTVAPPKDRSLDQLSLKLKKETSCKEMCVGGW